uniref:N-acetyltransferase domain-containing protein n=1 Tax=Nicotiana tabacum TaxID=4097 RepID=A0A1S4BA15_TOBAC
FMSLISILGNDFGSICYLSVAEVLSGLLYRLRNSPPDRYACLVAEPSSDSPQDIVGVVDATAFRDNDVLQYLPGAAEYLYISGIAVLNKFRRQKVATALLKACDVLARFWGFDYLALRAYEDDFGARRLYTNAGYRLVSSDPPWTTTWIGRRRRVLMVKQVLHESTTNIH